MSLKHHFGGTMDDYGFKSSLSLDQQILILKSNKRVVYNVIGEEEAKEILLKYNYINVISPFKYRFAEWGTSDGQPLKIKGSHVYMRDVEFSEYVEAYNQERSVYPALYHSISEFEILFNSVLSYFVFSNYTIKTRFDLISFFNMISQNIDTQYAHVKRRQESKRQLTRITIDIHRCENQFVFFDRLSLGALVLIFDLLHAPVKKDILASLKERNGNLGMQSILDFSKRAYVVVGIRNTIYHSNSLTILIRYQNAHRKIMRTSSDRKIYLNTLRVLLKDHEKSQFLG